MFFEYRQLCTQAPSQLGAAELLGNADLSLTTELVTQTQETVHKCQVETGLWSVVELLYRFACKALAVVLCVAADAFGQLAQLVNREFRAKTKRLDSVKKVRQRNDGRCLECLHQRRLVHTTK